MCRIQKFRFSARGKTKVALVLFCGEFGVYKLDLSTWIFDLSVLEKHERGPCLAACFLANPLLNQVARITEPMWHISIPATGFVRHANLHAYFLPALGNCSLKRTFFLRSASANLLQVGWNLCKADQWNYSSRSMCLVPEHIWLSRVFNSQWKSHFCNFCMYECRLNMIHNRRLYFWGVRVPGFNPFPSSRNRVTVLCGT